MTISAGEQRVDPLGVAPERLDSLAHRGEVDDAGHAGEVLHDHAGGRELDLGVGLGRGIPRAERLDLRLRDVRAVFGAEQVLEQHLQAERELLVAGHGVDAEDLVVGAADRQGALGTEAVNRGHVCLLRRRRSGRAARHSPSSRRRAQWLVRRA